MSLKGPTAMCMTKWMRWSIRKYFTKIQSSYFQPTSFLLRQTSAWEEPGSKKQKNSLLLPIGTCWRLPKMKEAKEVVMRILSLTIRSSIVSKQTYTKRLEDYSWHKIDQMLLNRPWMSWLRAFTLSVPSMAQRVSIYAVVTIIWANFSKRKAHIPLAKQKRSFRRSSKFGKSLSSKRTSTLW